MTSLSILNESENALTANAHPRARVIAAGVAGAICLAIADPVRYFVGRAA